MAAVWENNPDVKVGNVSLDEFTAAIDAAEALDKEYAKKDVDLTGVKNNRDDKALLLGQIATRFRSGMRFIYGSDSPEYGQAGGTRDRDRKSPKPRTKLETA